MAGKRCALATPRLAHALDKLSKNALADLVVQLVLSRSLGGELTDLQIATTLQEQVATIAAARKDNVVSLVTMMGKYDQHVAKYRRENT